MLKLLKTDLIRIFKDKLFLVLSIIGLAFALFTPVLYKLIFSLNGLSSEDFALFDMVEITGKAQFFAAFSPANNFGLIAPILICIILFKDFSQGTVRNKIICGNRRSHIFLSMFISGLVALFAVVLAHALVSLCLSSAFFGYQYEAFKLADFGYLMLSLLFELVVFAFLASFMAFLCVSSKNMGLVILSYVAFSLLATMLSGISLIAQMLIDPEKKIAIKIFEIILKINVFSNGLIGTGTSYNTETVLYILIPSLVFTAILVGLGIVVLNKKDLK